MWKLPMTEKLQDIGIRKFVIYKINEKLLAGEIKRIGKLNVRAYSMIVQNLETDNLGFASTTLPPANEFNGTALCFLLQKKYAKFDLVSRCATR
ncbi:hypothetical protein VP01_5067g3 [Puccinia sorghi]|uniref:Uncharacterized protein n=1 Tax=Puccinia sorghi TaxID=27349 RepID=A0A0L6ULH6_9BASI|nr:hypothetical protein VP01_5067g3 [Puccinia sorghi]